MLSTNHLAILGLLGVLVPSLGLAAPPEKGTTFKAPGTTLYVEVLGTAGGVPLVIVNGGPGFDHTYDCSSRSSPRVRNAATD